MAEGQIARLPKLGEITLPVHLMSYDDKKNKKKHFTSGFAFWKAADGASDVSDDTHDLGSIGGTMGGHVEMCRYYGKKHGEEYEQWAQVIIDVRDIWNQIEELLESENVKVTIDGLEEINEKYQAILEKEEEIKKMQEEADKEAARKLEKEKAAINPYKEIETSNGTKYEILENPHGWDVTESFKGRDVDFYENYSEQNRINGKIPLNIGCDLKMKGGDHDKILYTGSEPDSGVVTLKISTWRGISPEAIHYYGSLDFHMPHTRIEGERGSYISCWLNMFTGGEIDITRKLESWEKEKYPNTYDDWDVGDNYRGFYKLDNVIEAGKKVFERLFSDEWELKIEKLF